MIVVSKQSINMSEDIAWDNSFVIHGCPGIAYILEWGHPSNNLLNIKVNVT